MAGGRIYVLNSPELVLSVQRLPKRMSFWFIEANFTAKLGGMSKEAGDKLLKNLHDDQEGPSVFLEGMKAMHKATMPSEGVDQMVRVTAEMTSTDMSKLDLNPNARRIDLWDWVQHTMTIATTQSIYGPRNPYLDPEVEYGFHRFTDDTVMLLANFWPGILARKGYAGREKVVKAFEKYFAANGDADASQLTKARASSLRRDFEPNDLARFETVNGIAIIANTIPTTFWTMFHVFSDAELLKRVREQVSSITTVTKEHGVVAHTIDISRIKEVSILNSTLQESLRHRGSGTGTRYVMDDVMLDDRYLLKKGSFLIIPNHVMHFNTQAWGDSVQDFDPNRWTKSSSQKIHSGAFRGFGGGVNLCPGRFFATTEITAMIAMFAMRYDLAPVSGRWEDPEQDFTNMSLAIAPPRKKVVVDVVPRKGWEGETWAFKL
ncbi:hypothetical protein MMC18_007689 [Xylographa bjoerkii]|nr:hypothetical protein [Xylographa bjoerkii]